jgi:hypothetical protein
MGTESDASRASALDRRTLIKRAAVAGAVAWTAPVVIESLASPAAAGTCGCGGCYYVEFRAGVCGDTNNQYHTFQTPDHTCQPDYSTVSGCGTCVAATGQPAADLCIDTSSGCAEDDETITMTIIPNCTPKNTSFSNCRFLSGAGQAEDGEVSCVTAPPGVVITENGHTITFDRLETIDPETNRWTEFRVILCCD